jgi:comEA protein
MVTLDFSESCVIIRFIMFIVFSLIIAITIPFNTELQIGYWTCDVIRQEMNVDFVILPNIAFSDSTLYKTDSLILTVISIRELNEIISENTTLSKLVPIAGFTVIIDSSGNYKALPNNTKEQYSLITTKSITQQRKVKVLTNKITDILVSYLKKQNHISLPQMNRYQFVTQTNNLEPSNEPKSTKVVTKININTATQEELESLPGIGPKTAQKIIEYRLENGPFKSVEEIVNIKGIKQKKFDKIKDLITI